MTYQQTIDSCFGAGTGLDRSAFETALTGLEPALASLQGHYRDGSLPILRLPELTDDLEELEAVAARWRTAFDDVVVLGTGGSSLGGQTLYSLADQGFGPCTTGKRCATPKLHFVDNVDPATIQAMLEALDLSKTGFIAISKSGTTAETLTQFLLVIQALEAKLSDSRVKLHCLVITEPKPSPLRHLAEKLEIQTLIHDPGVGGRFSALSLVGLLPALIAGLDGRAIREGASRVLSELLEARKPEDCRPAVGAALNVSAIRAGMATTILMPYADRLRYFGLWWKQLWAESLGKQGKGSTPANATGTVDQHSQLQLYLDGPKDKLYTVLTLETAGQGDPVRPATAEELGLPWLAGRTIGDLLDAEARASIETLIKNERPVRHILLGRLREQEMGLLMFHFELETIFAAALLDVDPFDQPAVEQGKILTREYMAALER